MESMQKLAHGLAIFRALAAIPFILLFAACSEQELSGPATSPETLLEEALRRGGGKPLGILVISPDSAVLATGAKQVFTAVALQPDSSEVSVKVRWKVTGGEIDSNGLYTAPAQAGDFAVVGSSSGGRADTAKVRVVPLPKLEVTRVLLSPDTATVAPGATQAFTAAAEFSDGSTGPVSATYTATGGSVSPEGLYTAGETAGRFRVIATAANGKADSSDVTVAAPSPAPPAQTPYDSTLVLPDTIQAEHFDRGGEEIAHHDADSTNNGGAFRNAEAVDVKTSSDHGGGYAVGWMVQGEWLEYSVRVATTGTYQLESRVATPFPGKTFHIEIDGKDVTGPLSVPVTGPWNTAWASVAKPGVSLTEGSHIIRFVADASDFDLNYLVVAPEGTPPPPEDPLPPPPPSGEVEPDRQWAGLNANTGYFTDGAYVGQVNTHANALGTGSVRMGIDNVGGTTCGSAFNWAARDATVSSHRAAGLAIHAVIEPRVHVAGADHTQRLTNWRCFVAAVLARYQGKIAYYIVSNEPDFAWNGVQYTPQQLVDFTRVAYEESRRIAPDGSIKIESPPTTNPGSSYLQQMINLGVTRYADYLGVHGYGAQINDEHGAGLRKPWEFMASSGHPIRRVANSENGTSTEWGSRIGANGTEWQARWFRLNYVQHKRYGYDHALLYSIRSQSPSFNFADWDGARVVPVQPTYDAIRAAYVKRPFGNGGFEEPNDRELEWVIYHWVDQASPAEWNRVAFVRGDGTRARSGTGYLRFDTGESSARNIVRRVVEHLTPGQTYTISAWVRITGGGTATLKAQGFNHVNGTQEASQSTATRDSWQQLSVTFTPRKTWVVIGLEGTGTGTSGHVMAWDDVTLSR